ncbi:MAG: hypothetical protein WBP12_01535 [Candidatus Saccharimonas sp.]
MNILKRIAMVIMILLAVVACAHSTPGVRVIGNNVIELPVGETAEFSGYNNGSQIYWSVWFDGKERVNFSCRGGCFGGSAHVPNVGDADWAFSSSLYGRFDVTRVSNNAVNVYWPYGIKLE